MGIIRELITSNSGKSSKRVLALLSGLIFILLSTIIIVYILIKNQLETKISEGFLYILWGLAVFCLLTLGVVMFQNVVALIRGTKLETKTKKK